MPQISFEKKEIWSFISKEITSPYGPKFPFFDFKNYLPKTLKNYYIKEKSPIHPYHSNSIFDSYDDIASNSPMLPANKLANSQEIIKPTKNQAFLSKIEEKLSKIHPRDPQKIQKKIKKSLSFEIESRPLLKIKVYSKPKSRKKSINFEDFDGKKQEIPKKESNFLRNYNHFKKKSNAMIFTQKGSYRLLKTVSSGFAELLDSMNIRSNDKKLVNEGALILSIRRKSACDKESSGGICKKLEKNACYMTLKEKKVNIINLLILKGRKEYALQQRKRQKTLVKNNSGSFNQKIMKAYSKAKRASAFPQSNQEILFSVKSFEDNNENNEKSKSIEVCQTEKKNFVKSISKFSRVNQHNEENKHKKLPVLERNLINPIKNRQTVKHMQYSPLIIRTERKNFEGFEEKSLEQAIKITANNSHSSSRINELFNISRSTPEKKTYDRNYYNSYDLQEYKKFLEKKLVTSHQKNTSLTIEKKKKQINLQPNETSNPYFLKDSFNSYGNLKKKPYSKLHHSNI